MTESADRSVIIMPQAEKDLRHVHRRDLTLIGAAINALAHGPAHGDFRRLRGGSGEWRLRVGDWRVRFRPDFESRTIFVLHILPRGSACRR